MSIGVGEMDLSNVRKEYVKGELRRQDLDPNPFVQFQHWYAQAAEVCNLYENSMAVATVDAQGRPDLRTVLLKGFNTQGFVFYTNMESNKAQQILANPQVTLLFHWIPLERQVIIRGEAVRVSDQEAHTYFNSRPRGSQLGAWASHQSQPIASRTVLETALQEHQKRFEGRDVPKPDYWGGFRVIPRSIEFWQGQEDRLHDRFIYERGSSPENSWQIQRISP